MGNIVNNPNSKNNEFKRKTVFDKKIIDILKNVTTVNDTNIPNIPTFKDPITGKNIYYKHQMQACCLNALYPKDKLPADTDSALLNDPTSYLRIPLPILNTVDCSDPAKIDKIDQEMCLNTADVNIAFEDMDKDGKQLLVERTKEGWLLDGKFHVRPDVIEVLLYTIRSVEVKSPVSKQGKINVIKVMAAKSTKIEIYSKGQKVKQYYVGNNNVIHILENFGDWVIL